MQDCPCENCLTSCCKSRRKEPASEEALEQWCARLEMEAEILKRMVASSTAPRQQAEARGSEVAEAGISALHAPGAHRDGAFHLLLPRG
jgi:hypothetical protein